jgi:hypothetical protein
VKKNIEELKERQKMKDITKEKLLALGFEEVYSTPEQSGTEKGFYYYTYNIDGQCLLISDASDENDGNYTIEFSEFNSIKIFEFEELIKFIEIVKRNTK